MVEKGLISRTVESKLPAALGKSELEGSDSDDSELNMRDNCLTPEGMEFELTGALGKSDLEKQDFDDGFMNVKGNCSDREKLNSEMPEVFGKCHSENMDFDDMTVCLTPEKIELELPVETIVDKCESNVFSERCLRSRKVAFQITGGDKVAKKLCLSKKGITENKEETMRSTRSNKKQNKQKSVAFFVGLPISEEEAQERWHWRYELKVWFLSLLIFFFCFFLFNFC